ncbi:hypothetical protein KBD34_03680 [Patescibacteria group bacterium]|nr:hypothetical protein [Patescibacteria group bacterium]
MGQPNEAEDPIIEDWAERVRKWDEAWKAALRSMTDLETCIQTLGHRPLHPNLSVAKAQEDWDQKHDHYLGEELEFIRFFGPRPVENAAHDSNVIARMSRMTTTVNRVPTAHPPGTVSNPPDSLRSTLVGHERRPSASANDTQSDGPDEFGNVTAELPTGAAPTESQGPPEEQGADLPAVMAEPKEYRLLTKDQGPLDYVKAPTRPSPVAPAPNLQPEAAEDQDPPLTDAERVALLAAAGEPSEHNMRLPPAEEAMVRGAAAARWAEAQARRRAELSKSAEVAAPIARPTAAQPAHTPEPTPSAPDTTPPDDQPAAEAKEEPLKAQLAKATPAEEGQPQGPTTDKLAIERPTPPPSKLIRPYNWTMIAAAFFVMFVCMVALGVKISEQLAGTQPTFVAAAQPRHEMPRAVPPTKRVIAPHAQPVQRPQVIVTAPSPTTQQQRDPNLARCITAEEYGQMTNERQAPYSGVCTYSDHETVAFRCLREDHRDMRNECGTIAQQCPTLDPTCLARQHRTPNASVARRRANLRPFP